jgi:hypothetical protein
MSEDEATNTFTIGSVEIKQLEQQREVDGNGNFTGDLEDFENDKQLIPVIDNSNAKDDVNFQDKIVTVQNIGKNDAYVQTFVAIPKALADANVLYIQAGDQGGWEAAVDAGVVLESAIVDGSQSTTEYRVFKYVYNTFLAAKADGATAYPTTTLWRMPASPSTRPALVNIP